MPRDVLSALLRSPPSLNPESASFIKACKAERTLFLTHFPCSGGGGVSCNLLSVTTVPESTRSSNNSLVAPLPRAQRPRKAHSKGTAPKLVLLPPLLTYLRLAEELKTNEGENNGDGVVINWLPPATFSKEICFEKGGGGFEEEVNKKSNWDNFSCVS